MRVVVSQLLISWRWELAVQDRLLHLHLMLMLVVVMGRRGWRAISGSIHLLCLIEQKSRLPLQIGIRVKPEMPWRGIVLPRRGYIRNCSLYWRSHERERGGYGLLKVLWRKVTKATA